jgi:hypothetical protein
MLQAAKNRNSGAFLVMKAIAHSAFGAWSSSSPTERAARWGKKGEFLQAA